MVLDELERTGLRDLGGKKTIFTRTFEFRLSVLVLLFCLVFGGQSVAGEPFNNQQNTIGFRVAEIALGMSIEEVRKIYPAAAIEKKIVNCYSYGEAISIPELTWRTLHYHHKTDILTLHFKAPVEGNRLYKIHYDRAVDLTSDGVQKLLGHLVQKYGPYNRILHRRKMEPEGRIVGFEWQKSGDVTLRIVLRQDHGNSNDSLRLSVLSTLNDLQSRPQKRALSVVCAKRPTGALNK